MRIRTLLLSLMIGAGLFLPTQTPALAKKTSYKQHKNKKYKASRKFKGGKKVKGHNKVKHATARKH
jgi:hypothetical protein